MMDATNVVILPIPASLSGKTETKWRLVVTNPTIMNSVALVLGRKQVKWKVMDPLKFDLSPPLTFLQDLDGRNLRFLTSARPARRYLYFRFLMTAIGTRKRGPPMDAWVKDETKGCMWATPGAYLRESMLKILALQDGHHFLPDALMEGCTFDDDKESPRLPKPLEESHSRALDLHIDLANRRGLERVQADDDSKPNHSDEDDSADESKENRRP
jgi:hypothetical protein